MRAAVLPRAVVPGALLALLLGNAALAYGLAAERRLPAVLLAVAPALAFALAYLIVADSSILVFAALAIGMAPASLKDPLSISGVNVYAGDVIVLLAIFAWLGARLLHRGEDAPRLPSTPVLSWPFVLFAGVIVAAVVRGHEYYEASLIGRPLRLALYAAIIFAMIRLDAKQAHRGIVAVFYIGTVWVSLNAAYHLATGTSQTRNETLSTGGVRVLALTVSLYLVPALFLALLNLEIDHSARGRALHFSIALLAIFGIVVGYGRGVYAAVVIVLPFLLLCFRHLRAGIVGLLPLFLPLLVVAGILGLQAAPHLSETFTKRVTGTSGTDSTVRWRQEANEAVLEQVHESPVTGVGFGRPAHFNIPDTDVRRAIGQDPHNGYMFLLAGGGALALGSFLLVVLVFVWDSLRRFAHARTEHERLIIVWAGASLFAFLLNALVEPMFSWSTVVLTIWILLLMPSIVKVDRSWGLLRRHAKA